MRASRTGPVRLDRGIRTGLGNDRLQIGPGKIVSDGSFIGRSAAMHHCYHGEPDNYGVLLFDPAELQAMIIGAHDDISVGHRHGIESASDSHAGCRVRGVSCSGSVG